MIVKSYIISPKFSIYSLNNTALIKIYLLVYAIPLEDAGGLSREYVLRIPSVS